MRDTKRRRVKGHRTAVEPYTATHFARVALFAGNPFCWLTDAASDSKIAPQFADLLKRCLLSPDIQLDSLGGPFAPLDRDKFLELVGTGAEYKALHDIVVNGEVSPFLSWKPINLRRNGLQTINTPLLALWSTWPSTTLWAPPLGAAHAKPVPLSADSAVQFLTFGIHVIDLLEEEVAKLGPCVAATRFGNYSAHLPIFFYAEPISPPEKGEIYAQGDQFAVSLLVRSCLQSDDPQSRDLAWGTLEGGLVALRREMVSNESYRPRYLLLPTAGTRRPSEELEEHIHSVTTLLTELESSICNDVGDLDQYTISIQDRQAVWNSVLDNVTDVLGDTAGPLYSAREVDLEKVHEELRRLLVLMRSCQAKMERLVGEVAAANYEFRTSKDSVDDRLRNGLPPQSQLGPVTLRGGLLDAFPYHYLEEPIQQLREDRDYWRDRLDRLTTLLSTILTDEDQRRREVMERWTGKAAFVIGLLALAIALPTLIEKSAVDHTNYPGWLAHYIPFNALQGGVRIVAVVFGGIGLAQLLIYIWNLVRHHLPRHEDYVMTRFAKLWELSEKSADCITRVTADSPDGKTWERVEKLDKKAAKLVSSLGQQRRLTRRIQDTFRIFRIFVQTRRISKLIDRIQETRLRIVLFVLSPDIIALPRSLCIIRYRMAKDQYRDTDSNVTHSLISLERELDRRLEYSLLKLEFKREEINTLVEWLSGSENLQWIKEHDVREFAKVLREQGVTVIRDRRAPEKWNGSLDALKRQNHRSRRRPRH